MTGLVTDADDFSEELNRQVGEALWWLSRDDGKGAERLAGALNTSTERDLWWQLLAHLKLVVEEDMDTVQPMGDC